MSEAQAVPSVQSPYEGIPCPGCKWPPGYCLCPAKDLEEAKPMSVEEVKASILRDISELPYDTPIGEADILQCSVSELQIILDRHLIKLVAK